MATRRRSGSMVLDDRERVMQHCNVATATRPNAAADHGFAAPTASASILCYCDGNIAAYRAGAMVSELDEPPNVHDADGATGRFGYGDDGDRVERRDLAASPNRSAFGYAHSSTSARRRSGHCVLYWSSKAAPGTSAP